MKYLPGVFALFAVVLVSACSQSAPATVPSTDVQTLAQPAQAPGLSGLTFRHACGPAAPRFAQCHSQWAIDARKPRTPSGYAPGNLQAAYGLTTASSSSGAGQTVAIVDAYDDPNAESDLAVYRAQFGLPACTAASGCFRKVDQTGGTSYPRTNRGWAEEISLDVDMVSAICPKCHILLVEANTNFDADLDAAVDEAAALGATEISNSYGGPEYDGESSEEPYFNHPGIAITASSGDDGYGAEYPASSRYVTAVGGTSLRQTGTTYSETAWDGAGSGCSAYIAQPSWQDGLQSESTVCPTHRMVADVAAVADPYTGVAVYDSFRQTGWLVFGGTSVSAPIIASVYALAGNASSVNYGAYPYAHSGSLHDVTSGSNGNCGTFLCTATAGYDGPTGLGTPSGTNAF